MDSFIVPYQATLSLATVPRRSLHNNEALARHFGPSL